MTREGRQNLRKVARERDKSQAHAKFHLAQADMDLGEAKERRAAADKAKAKAAERRVMLEELDLVLSLERLQDEGPGCFTVKQIQAQIAWHRTIGQDVHIPTGVHRKKKVEVWDIMVRAVRRHLRGTSAAAGECFTMKH